MAVSNSLQETGEKKLTVSQFLSNKRVSLTKTLGNEKEAQKFISSILSATSANLTLQECEHGTILSAALLANALNLSLSPQLGLAYLVPFNDNTNNRLVATFVLGYKGYIQLAIRSGYYKKINVIAIKEGEFVKYDPLTEELFVNLIADDEVREATPTVGYYAMFELTNGFMKTLYWSKKKMLIHADKYSKAFSLNGQGGKCPKVSYEDFCAGNFPKSEMWKYSSFWYKDFDGMAFKTMLRQLISKWGIMSIDMQTAYEDDSRAMRDNDDYIAVSDDSVAPPIQKAQELKDGAPSDSLLGSATAVSDASEG